MSLITKHITLEKGNPLYHLYVDKVEIKEGKYPKMIIHSNPKKYNVNIAGGQMFTVLVKKGKYWIYDLGSSGSKGKTMAQAWGMEADMMNMLTALSNPAGPQKDLRLEKAEGIAANKLYKELLK